MASVFVTGGSGFIGGRLISRLIADGHTVKALARSQAAAQRVAGLGAIAVPGDLQDLSAVRAAAAGSEWAVHAAARTSRSGTRREFWSDNVDGTSTVLQAVREAGTRRLVHVGTEAALMVGQPLVDIDETAPLRPDSPAPYAASKAAAEQRVLAASDGNLETVVVRPRFVWGAGDATVMPELVAAVKAGRFAWVGGGRQLTATTHVDNAVEGLMLAAQQGRPGEAYFVTDAEPVIFREFICDLLATQSIRPPGRSIPIGLAGVAARLGESVWRGLRLRGGPPLDTMTLWLSALECTIDITKARTELGYAPVRRRADGLAELRG